MRYSHLLLNSRSEFGLHIVCDFGGQARFRWGVLDSNGRKRNTISPSWSVAYNKGQLKGEIGKLQIGTRVPREQVSDANAIKITTYDELQVAI